LDNLLKWIYLYILELIRLLVYGNILIGFGAFGLSKIICSSLYIPDEMQASIPLFLFAATTFTYNIHRRIGYAMGSKESISPTTQWMLDKPLLSKSISIFSFVMALLYMVDLPKKALFVIIPISLISLFYVQRLSEGKKVLREIPYLKIFLIAAVWTAVLVILPSIFIEADLSKILFLSFGIFLYMISEIIPFDIRDMKRDEIEQTKTIPLLIGIKNSKGVAIGLLLIANLLLYLYFSTLTIDYISILLSSFFLSFMVINSKKDRSDLYYSFLVELSLILPYLFSLFISFLWS